MFLNETKKKLGYPNSTYTTLQLELSLIGNFEKFSNQLYIFRYTELRYSDEIIYPSLILWTMCVDRKNPPLKSVFSKRNLSPFLKKQVTLAPLGKLSL